MNFWSKIRNCVFSELWKSWGIVSITILCKIRTASDNTAFQSHPTDRSTGKKPSDVWAPRFVKYLCRICFSITFLVVCIFCSRTLTSNCFKLMQKCEQSFTLVWDKRQRSQASDAHASYQSFPAFPYYLYKLLHFISERLDFWIAWKPVRRDFQQLLDHTFTKSEFSKFEVSFSSIWKVKSIRKCWSGSKTLFQTSKT